MKRNVKITVWTIAAILLLSGCIIGGLFLINSPFEKTRIYPDDSRKRPVDTIFTVNGIDIKMIGVNGGKIKCKGLNRTIELKDFYIGETEVTQELWMSVMGNNPSVHKDSILCPVEGMDLVECLEFVHKLNSVSGIKFYIQSYPEWLYVAYLGCEKANTPYYDDSTSWYKEISDDTTHPAKQKKPNALGVYDMIGNVSEWTISGSDPLFFVMGGSYETEKESCKIDAHNVYHANIKMGSTGLRLVCYPEMAEKQDSTEANSELTSPDSIESVESESYEDDHVCVSEDGRVSIESGIVPGGGTSPDYWAKWTITDNTGKKHVIMNPETPYQSKIHTITKTDGTVYYIVNCYGKASSVDGYEWLQAYKIVGDTIQEVNVADGGSNICNNDFSVNYDIPSWYFATNGAGYDWIFEYDIHTKDLYVPITTEDRIIIDRYKIWHFNGDRFIYQGERSHKNLHESLANYNTLICYATTRDYILRIDSLNDGKLRYASWKRPKTMTDKPDIIIKGGEKRHYEVAPDELCPCDDYRFYNGCFEYVVNYCEVKMLDDGSGEHHDFLLVKRNGKIMIKQELEK